MVNPVLASWRPSFWNVGALYAVWITIEVTVKVVSQT